MTTPTETAIAAIEEALEVHCSCRKPELGYERTLEQALAALRAPVDVQDLVGDICQHFRVTPSGVHGQWLRHRMILPTPPPAAGGMKAEPYTRIDDNGSAYHLFQVVMQVGDREFDVGPSREDLSEAENFKLMLDRAIAAIQADALATQPEARPLRELIAKGIKHVWVWLPQDTEPTIIHTQHIDESYLDCPAIPIPKPTVTL